MADRVLTPAREIGPGVIDQQVDGIVPQELRAIADLARVGLVEPMHAHREALVYEGSPLRRRVQIAGKRTM